MKGGRIVIREGMKRCEQQCPSLPVPLVPPRRFPPSSPRRLLQPAPREAHRAATERSDRQYLAITKYEFTFNNCGKHRRTRRVATGGESDEIRSRPRAPAFEVNSDLLLLLLLLLACPLSLRIYIIIIDGCCCTLPNTPADANPPVFSSTPMHFCYTPGDKSDFPILHYFSLLGRRSLY